MITPFHLAIPVHDLMISHLFYTEVLGCEEGRSTDIWIDYNFFGHQLVCHKTNNKSTSESNNPVDGKSVPVPHFGVVLEMSDWRDLRDKLIANNSEFVITTVPLKNIRTC